MMQDFLGSVRRSIAFRAASDDNKENNNNNNNNNNDSNNILFSGTSVFVEKLNSICIRKSKIFSAKPFSSPPSPPPPPHPPPMIRYRKGQLIGCGAFGQVYMGMNLDSGELLAIKLVSIAANGTSRAQDIHIRELEEEVKLLKNLSHPNIVRYLGTVREEESLNILLEFVPGGSIQSLLTKFGPFPEAVIRTYTKQLLLGLEYLHKNGIMHRDIKGANILVDNKGCIKLADFGASKQVVELATMSGAKSMKGTPYWMAPEVILQTGHSFSADVWSVGCTVIEMATGKPPWSQQYQEVAALFYIGSTKSHPEIPDHLSAEAKDFLLKCLHKEPNMRPGASELLQHPFVIGEKAVSGFINHNPLMENSEVPSQSHNTGLETFEIPSISDTSDMCNLGSLNCSVDPKKLPETKDLWGTNNSDDDMCQIDRDDITIKEVKLIPLATPGDFNKSYNPTNECPKDWRCTSDESPELEPAGTRPDMGGSAQEQLDNNFAFPCGASLSEDDDELTESKIRAFLDEKALELKKLQTPLFEEFYNSLNMAYSPNFSENLHEETPPNYLKLPPKSRSPSQVPVGSPSATSDVVSTGSPGRNSGCVSNAGDASDQTQDNSSPQCNDKRGHLVDVQPESSCPSSSVSERQKKWKQELDQELERKREMMRQVGVGSKTSSPKDRALSRQRERTRFSSPSK